MSRYAVWVKKFLRDRNGVVAVIILFSLFCTAVLAPYIAPYGPRELNFKDRLQPPSVKHLFGTDSVGKDMFSRVIYGTRTSLSMAGFAVSISLLIGTFVGLIAGYYEGWIGSLLMRFADIFLSLPRIIMALLIVAVLGPGLRNAILALSITYWPFWTRIVYSNIVSLKKSPFIESTKALGASDSRIIFLHMLPNVLPDIITRTTISLGGTITAAALLSYVGLGVQPPAPDWGLDLALAREYLPNAWWFALFPGIAILITVMAFNMLGDTLRDTIDPRLRGSGE